MTPKKKVPSWYIRKNWYQQEQFTFKQQRWLSKSFSENAVCVIHLSPVRFVTNVLIETLFTSWDLCWTWLVTHIATVTTATHYLQPNCTRFHCVINAGPLHHRQHVTQSQFFVSIYQTPLQRAEYKVNFKRNPENLNSEFTIFETSICTKVTGIFFTIHLYLGVKWCIDPCPKDISSKSNINGSVQDSNPENWG